MGEIDIITSKIMSMDDKSVDFLIAFCEEGLKNPPAFMEFIHVATIKNQRDFLIDGMCDKTPGLSKSVSRDMLDIFDEVLKKYSFSPKHQVYLTYSHFYKLISDMNEELERR